MYSIITSAARRSPETCRRSPLYNLATLPRCCPAMPYPSLDDDGQSVTLDLHGATVDEAMRLSEALVREACRRGRSQVRLIHGSSTSSAAFRNRTIKHALEEAVARGRFAPDVVDALHRENVLTLSLGVSAERDTASISMLDLTR